MPLIARIRALVLGGKVETLVIVNTTNGPVTVPISRLSETLSR